MKKIYAAAIAVIGLAFLSASCSKSTTDTQQLQALTDTIVINQSDWTPQQNGSYIFGYNLNDFSQDIHYNGAYWAYISFDNEDTYTLLGTTMNGYTFDAHFDEDQTQSGVYGVTIEADPLSANAAAPSGQIIIKVVSIPSQFNAQSNVNMKDYNAVKSAYHLK